ncbi:MAG: serine hydroxymethyltransferase [Armatimonadetes bacterium]|nr:serine hydroxymethyltransferase [Armatimonadota bacterium]MDW8027275.1 serine hydroxymethyltransferase [Armatimonadota bacterium]
MFRLFETLLEVDHEIFDAIVADIERQNLYLNLIASENYTSLAVLAALANPMQNKYAEGYPSRRYYGGCDFVDIAERLAIERAKQLFNAEHANVQPHAGVQANMAVYFACLEHNDVILAPALAHGGHLSHGAPITASGKFYRVVQYGVNKENETIDFDQVHQLAREHKPKLIICGYSAYSRVVEFDKFREIADGVGALLLADIAHIAGLVAAGAHPSPVPYSDFVTTTTHKTLRGPRGALILCKSEWAQAIDKAVFPGNQGGPFMHVIAAKAVCFKEAMSEEFRQDQFQTVANARALAEELQRQGFRIVSGGTDNHLMLVDLRPFNPNLTGADAEKLLQRAHIIVNKNAIPFDERPPMKASGIRIGTPACTTRKMREDEMKLIGRWIAKVLRDPEDETIEQVRNEVVELCQQFPVYAELWETMKSLREEAIVKSS